MLVPPLTRCHPGQLPVLPISETAAALSLYGSLSLSAPLSHPTPLTGLLSSVIVLKAEGKMLVSFNDTTNLKLESNNGSALLWLRKKE